MDGVQVTRRVFLMAPAAILVAPESSAPKFGRVTPTGWVAHLRRTGNELRVIVDGQDVTYDCYMADDKKGLALINLRDERGHHYVGTDGKIARRKYRGPVRIIERPAKT